jgi:putative endonuclease
MEWADQIRNELIDWSIAGLDWVAAQRGRSNGLPAHLITGIQGEEAACSFLRQKGYIVVARRWSAGNVPGDLDLIAWQGPLLCIAEVRTRTAHDITPAEATIDGHKRKVLRRLAHHYLRQLPCAAVPQVRFDEISVYIEPGQKPEITHFENAFGWNENSRDER